MQLLQTPTKDIRTLHPESLVWPYVSSQVTSPDQNLGPSHLLGSQLHSVMLDCNWGPAL